MVETRIAKIASTDDNLFVGITEDMEWTIVPKPFLSGTTLKVGDYVHCYVLGDEEGFYLEQVPDRPLTSESEWMEQESAYQ